MPKKNIIKIIIGCTSEETITTDFDDKMKNYGRRSIIIFPVDLISAKRLLRIEFDEKLRIKTVYDD